ncbi:unnamed protein product [Polarella glacialis]|nr:unnamed protein product [Polarella glacialis]
MSPRRFRRSAFVASLVLGLQALQAACHTLGPLAFHWRAGMPPARSAVQRHAQPAPSTDDPDKAQPASSTDDQAKQRKADVLAAIGRDAAKKMRGATPQQQKLMRAQELQKKMLMLKGDAGQRYKQNKARLQDASDADADSDLPPKSGMAGADAAAAGQSWDSR